PDPEDAVLCSDCRSLLCSLEDGQLLSQGKVLKNQIALTMEPCYEKSKQQRYYLTHKERMSRSAMKVNDINRFEVLAKDSAGRLFCPTTPCSFKATAFVA